MNMRAEAQSNIGEKVPPTATLGIARQRHCAQHHRHHYRLCVEEEGKGKGPCGSLCCGLSFPTPPLWFPVLWFHVLPLPPVGQGARPSLGGQLRG